MENTIKKIKNYHTRMTTAINELERLENNPEDFLDALAISYGEIVRKCENRREHIQRRKYQ